MKRRRTPVRMQGQGGMVVAGWILAGASVVSSTAAVVMSVAALRRVAPDAASPDGPWESTDYNRVRISGVGDGPRVPRVPPLHSVAAVPPENPHAPPTPPLGNPAVRGQ